MIYDAMDGGLRYAGISPELWSKAFAYLETLTADAPVGRVELAGDDLYAMVQEYETKPEEKYRVETHANYLDIQLLLAGCETIYYVPDVAALTVMTRYNPEKDIAFFNWNPALAVAVPLRPGVFSAFFPGEGHLPGCGTPAQKVKKVVVKLRMR